MDKILIIGQAPPLKPQVVPYDSTLLYEMLSWVGISKEQAQEMFEFEALVEEFPGHTKSGGHKLPSKRDINLHWNNTLLQKFKDSNKIILLGRAAMESTKPIFSVYGLDVSDDHKAILYLPHPSRRNYSRIMNNKKYFTFLLKRLIENNLPYNI